MKDGRTCVVWKGELLTDPEMKETMHTILCDYYQAALRALEKQVKGMQQPRIASQGAPDYPKNPATMQTLRAAFGDKFR